MADPNSELHPVMLGAVPPDLEMFVDAIYKAEGGTKAKKPFGVLSVKTEGVADARRVAMNTVRNQYKRWQESKDYPTFIESMANRYVKNDPKGLANWLVNVPSIYKQLEDQKELATLGYMDVPVPMRPRPKIAKDYSVNLRRYKVD